MFVLLRFVLFSLAAQKNHLRAFTNADTQARPRDDDQNDLGVQSKHHLSTDPQMSRRCCQECEQLI